MQFKRSDNNRENPNNAMQGGFLRLVRSNCSSSGTGNYFCSRCYACVIRNLITCNSTNFSVAFTFISHHNDEHLRPYKVQGCRDSFEFVQNMLLVHNYDR